MRHVLVPLHIVHATIPPVWFTAYQTGVAIVSHVNSVVSLDEMMRGEENLTFYTVTRRTRQRRRRTRQIRRRWRQTRRRLAAYLTALTATRRRWRQIRRILTHFYGVTERSCIFIVTSDLTHWPNIDLWRHVYYAQLITYSWLCKLGHTPNYYSSPLMNIHDDSATCLLRDITSDVRDRAVVMNIHEWIWYCTTLRVYHYTMIQINN